MNKKKRMIFIGSILIALLLVTVGVTYAFYIYRGQGQRENMVKTGDLSFVYDETKNRRESSDAHECISNG